MWSTPVCNHLSPVRACRRPATATALLQTTSCLRGWGNLFGVVDWHLVIIVDAGGAGSAPSTTPPTTPAVRLVYPGMPFRRIGPSGQTMARPARPDVYAVPGQSGALRPARRGSVLSTRHLAPDVWRRPACVPAAYDSSQFRWAIYADVEYECGAGPLCSGKTHVIRTIGDSVMPNGHSGALAGGAHAGVLPPS